MAWNSSQDQGLDWSPPKTRELPSWLLSTTRLQPRTPKEVSFNQDHLQWFKIWAQLGQREFGIQLPFSLPQILHSAALSGEDSDETIILDPNTITEGLQPPQLASSVHAEDKLSNIAVVTHPIEVDTLEPETDDPRNVESQIHRHPSAPETTQLSLDKQPGLARGPSTSVGGNFIESVDHIAGEGGPGPLARLPSPSRTFSNESTSPARSRDTIGRDAVQLPTQRPRRCPNGSDGPASIGLLIDNLVERTLDSAMRPPEASGLNAPELIDDDELPYCVSTGIDDEMQALKLALTKTVDDSRNHWTSLMRTARWFKAQGEAAFEASRDCSEPRVRRYWFFYGDPNLLQLPAGVTYPDPMQSAYIKGYRGSSAEEDVCRGYLELRKGAPEDIVRGKVCEIRNDLAGKNNNNVLPGGNSFFDKIEAVEVFVEKGGGVFETVQASACSSGTAETKVLELGW